MTVNSLLLLCGGGLVTKSRPTLETSWTVACQVPLPMIFPRQEYWSGWLLSSPRDLPNPGVEPVSPALQANSLPTGPPGKCVCTIVKYNQEP